MNTTQITRILSTCKLTKHCFRGVYSIDMIPSFVHKKPSSFIINTDPSYKPGTHWVAIHFPLRGPAEFFDSFGRAPFDKRFTKFILNNSDRYIYNSIELQHPYSLMCGKYCCLYLVDRCSDKTLKTFLNRFNKNMTKMNDQIVNLLFKKIFKKKKQQK